MPRVSADIDTFLKTADNAAARTALSAASSASVTALKMLRRPALPQVMGRVAEIGRTGIETVNLHFTGDSLAMRIPDRLLPIIESKSGLAGVGGILCAADSITGSPVIPPISGSSDAEATKFTEDGYVVLMVDEDAIKIGHRKITANPFTGDTFSIAFGTQSGNGSARISVSYDNGDTWQSAIETFDTSSVSVGLAVRTHTVDLHRQIVIRVEAVGGPVQVVQTRIWNSVISGVVLSYNGEGGASLGQYITRSSPAMRAQLMGMYAPHLVFGMFSEELHQIVDLDAWLQLVLDSAPTADIVMANLPYMGNRDPETYTDVINPYYANASVTFPRVFVYDINTHFKSIGYLTETGIGDPPNVHMDARNGLGWKSVAVDLAARIGLTTSTRLPAEIVGKVSSGGSVANLIVKYCQVFTNFWQIISGTAAINWLLCWYNSTGQLESIRMKRRESTATNAPSGMDFRYSIAGSLLTFAILDTAGCIKLGGLNEASTKSASADGFRMVLQTGVGQSALDLAGHASGSADIFRWRQGTTNRGRVTYLGEMHTDGGYHHGADGTGPRWKSGTGSPEEVLAAPVGSIYSRTDGGAGTSLYVKETGTGNTGWIAK